VSKYKFKPIDLHRVNTIPLRERESKVKVEDFATPPRPNGSFQEFISSFPHILAGDSFRQVVDSIIKAKSSGKPLIWGMGAHPIKCGLSPVITNLMEQGVIDALALNGAGVIHDVEVALIGQTSEEVEKGLTNGSFGMARETSEVINHAINEGVGSGLGIGEAVGLRLTRLKPPYLRYSILATAYRLNIPVTVHVAVGTDVTHLHPSAQGEAIGKGSHHDFRLFASLVAELNGGGVFMNVGSAVIIPEVLIKAVSLVRNIGKELRNFTTVDIDFIRGYRPYQNVVHRPVLQGGKGYSLIGHHEILLPLLAWAIVERLPPKGK